MERLPGARQLADALVDLQEAASHSTLVERLLLAVGWGLLSSNCARWIAEGATIDAESLDSKIHGEVVARIRAMSGGTC